MNKEEEPLNNFDENEELDFKFDWSIGKSFEHWLEVEGGRVRVRTEIEFFKTSEANSQLPSDEQPKWKE
jgi:hypothetical protein